MGFPKLNCKPQAKTKDGYEFGLYRDDLGNVTALFWKPGIGFKDDLAISYTHGEVKKLRDWLTKIIDHVERK